jgi:hypothetical protein
VPFLFPMLSVQYSTVFVFHRSLLNAAELLWLVYYVITSLQFYFNLIVLVYNSSYPNLIYFHFKFVKKFTISKKYWLSNKDGNWLISILVQ